VAPEPSAQVPWWRGARRDPVALAFGVAFVVFGAAALTRSMGARIEMDWISAAVLVSLGLAGLASVRRR
jgi:hypothetical protein